MSILHVAGADDAALAPAAGDQRRVAGHAAAGGQNALGRAHALNVLGVGFFADQDDGLALLLRFDGQSRGEDDLAAGPTRPSRKAGEKRLGVLLGSRIDDRVQQFIELRRLNAHHSGLLVDQPFGQHVHRHVQGGGAGPLADAALEHIELALLDREFDVLHVVVVFFELFADAVELPV